MSHLKRVPSWSTAADDDHISLPSDDEGVYIMDQSNIIEPSAPDQSLEVAATYDLTPVAASQRLTKRPSSRRQSESYKIVDPWEHHKGDKDVDNRHRGDDEDDEYDEYPADDDDSAMMDEQDGRQGRILLPHDIHPNMEHKEEDVEQLRLLAGQLSADWKGPDFLAPALARRIRDFQFAQDKRRHRYGQERPWGILGLYDHLSAIRIDVEWAEDAAWRRANGEPYLSWADFDETKKGAANRPYFTYILLAMCTIVMIASIVVNGWRVEPLDENPMIGPSAYTLIRMGAKDTQLIVEENEGWRLLSSTVLHAGLVHYAINMLALWFVGGAIEMSHGFGAALIIFLVSAVGGIVLSALMLPQYITVGASGGIFGFIGACLADIIMNWKLLFCDFVTENGKKHRHAMVVVFLLLDIALNSIIGLTPYIDNFTHLGGMAYGFLCGLCTIERLSSDFFGMEENWFTKAKHFIFRFFGIIISVIAMVMTILFLLLQSDGESSPCPNCQWLSCVPFPPWSPWWHCDDCGRVTADVVRKPYWHLEIHYPRGRDDVWVNIHFQQHNLEWH